MRVLILGGSGMLGHTLAVVASTWFDSYSVFRPHVDALRFETVEKVFEEVQPDVAVNCIGIIKQRKEAKDPILSIQINSLFPHQLAELCKVHCTHLIHISTDCVFSGGKGYYEEIDKPDPVDLYGHSKLLGEIVNRSHVLTLRTSFIGRELNTSYSLLEWFIDNRGGQVYGYRNVIYSGLTAHALSRIICTIIEDYPLLCGLYHIASEPISKYNLLCRINDAMHLNIEVIPCEVLICNRALDASKFKTNTGCIIPSWDEMIAELAKEPCRV